MPTKEMKTFDLVMSGKSDNNIKFFDLLSLIVSFGYECRIKGDHFICYHNDYPELINIQPKGNKAKSYQVKQIRDLIKKYNLGGGLDV